MSDCILAKGTAQNANDAEVRHSGAMLHFGRVSSQVFMEFGDVPRNVFFKGVISLNVELWLESCSETGPSQCLTMMRYKVEGLL